MTLFYYNLKYKKERKELKIKKLLQNNIMVSKFAVYNMLITRHFSNL